jgi:hypothetical protein
VLALAERDERILAAAVIGSLALGAGDDWSDLDLTFGLADTASRDDVLADWTRELADAFDAVLLFDLDGGELIYRVLLLPAWLQVDLSFAAGSAIQAREAFRPVFGPSRRKQVEPESAQQLFGLAVLYVRHALVAIERAQPWHAEYCVSGVRHQSLTLACLRRELPTGHGKGFDLLPEDVRGRFDGALVRSRQPAELRRALGVAVAGLLEEASDVDAAHVEAQLRELTAP